jgi:hypothetical protein
LGDISPLLSFQKPIGPLNEDIVTPGTTNTGTTMVNRINKNIDSNKSSDNKISIEEFQTYFDFTKSCLDAGQHRVLLEFLYEYADLFVKKGESLRVTNVMENGYQTHPRGYYTKGEALQDFP